MSNHPLIDSLQKTLASSYSLYLKTQNYHWNVTGPNFSSLHQLFEEQYTDLATAIDEIAELIRSHGFKVPADLNLFFKDSVIGKGDENFSSTEMLKDLAADQDKIIKLLNDTLKLAQDSEDEVTTDAIVGRLAVHTKNRWMLESSI